MAYVSIVVSESCVAPVYIVAYVPVVTSESCVAPVYVVASVSDVASVSVHCDMSQMWSLCIL